MQTANQTIDQAKPLDPHAENGGGLGRKRSIRRRISANRARGLVATLVLPAEKPSEAIGILSLDTSPALAIGMLHGSRREYQGMPEMRYNVGHDGARHDLGVDSAVVQVNLVAFLGAGANGSGKSLVP
jgi:hypothetical protein